MTVGNIGSSARANYAVLGNNMNLITLGGPRHAGADSRERKKHSSRCGSSCRGTEAGQAELKGISRPIRIFEIQEQ